MHKHYNQIRSALLLGAGVIIGSIFAPTLQSNAAAPRTAKPEWQYQTFYGTGTSVLNSLSNSLKNGYDLVDLKTTPQQGYSTPYTVTVVRKRR